MLSCIGDQVKWEETFYRNYSDYITVVPGASNSEDLFRFKDEYGITGDIEKKY